MRDIVFSVIKFKEIAKSYDICVQNRKTEPHGLITIYSDLEPIYKKIIKIYNLLRTRIHYKDTE